MQTVPKLRVQRMGKRWRIVYHETRNLAKFVNGEPVDDGGFLDKWQDGVKIQDGQHLALIRMAEVTSGKRVQDAESESVGH